MQGDTHAASDHLPVVMDFSVPPPVTQDSDLDGLDDSEEAQLGTDPFDADTDDDGLTDGLRHGCRAPILLAGHQRQRMSRQRRGLSIVRLLPFGPEQRWGRLGRRRAPPAGQLRAGLPLKALPFPRAAVAVKGIPLPHHENALLTENTTPFQVCITRNMTECSPLQCVQVLVLLMVHVLVGCRRHVESRGDKRPCQTWPGIPTPPVGHPQPSSESGRSSSRRGTLGRLRFP